MGNETFLQRVFFKTLVYRKINNNAYITHSCLLHSDGHVICEHLSASFMNNEPSDVSFPSLDFSIYYLRRFSSLT